MDKLGLQLLAIAIPAILSWCMVVARRPPRVDAATGATILEYAWPLRAIGVVTGVAVPLALAGLAFAFPPQTFKDAFAAGALMLGFTLLGGVLLVETARVRIWLHRDSIVSYSPWRETRTLRWPEVRKVSYSATNRWFVIEGPRGAKIRAHVFLVGIGALVDAIRTKVPPERYAEARAGFGEVQ